VKRGDAFRQRRGRRGGRKCGEKYDEPKIRPTTVAIRREAMRVEHRENEQRQMMRTDGGLWLCARCKLTRELQSHIRQRFQDSSSLRPVCNPRGSSPRTICKFVVLSARGDASCTPAVIGLRRGIDGRTAAIYLLLLVVTRLSTCTSTEYPRLAFIRGVLAVEFCSTVIRVCHFPHSWLIKVICAFVI